MARKRPAGKEFKGSYRGIREMLASAMVAGEMLRRAEQGAAYARQIAPKRSTAYARSIGATISIDDDGRIIGVIYSDDPAAYQIETGTRTTPAHRTLRRALVEGTG